VWYHITGITGTPYKVEVMNETTKEFKTFCGYELGEKIARQPAPAPAQTKNIEKIIPF
jgi:hypothetical protein